jgi:serine phosphatase RsbU (regulator of sigma subunit)
MAARSQFESPRDRRVVDSLTQEVLTVYEELLLLYSLSARFARLTEEDQIAAVALREAVEVSQSDCGWVAIWRDGAFHVPLGCRHNIEEFAVERINHAVLAPLQLAGKSYLLAHAFDRENHLPQPCMPGRLLACSVALNEVSQGYLCLGRKPDGRIFTAADEKLIRAVASQTAVALENVRLHRSELEKQRLAGDLELARLVQNSLLPSDFACCPFLEAAGVSLPCYEIGGDYFDLLPIDDNLGLVAMADVSGKGPAAALRATMVQGIVHTLANVSPEPREIAQHINRCIRARNTRSSFVTAFVALVDKQGNMRYSNGGHNPPICIRANGELIELAESGPLLGFFAGLEIPEASLQLEPDDLLLLYTDGVPDSENAAEETFGTERLLEWARLQAGRAPDLVKQALLETVKQFCAGHRQADDLTFLVLRLRQPEP